MTALLTVVSGSGPVRRLAIKITIDAVIGIVWKALTDISEVKNWWTDGVIEAEEGGRFRLDDGKEVNGTVKLCFPPYLFAFTWNDFPERAEHPSLIDSNTKSIVRFDLIELSQNQTSLSFVQYLPPGEVIKAAAGWHEIVGERLKDYIETGKVLDDPNRFSDLQKLYQEAGIK